jgi:hypothetical protein
LRNLLLFFISNLLPLERDSSRRDTPVLFHNEFAHGRPGGGGTRDKRDTLLEGFRVAEC